VRSYGCGQMSQTTGWSKWVMSLAPYLGGRVRGLVGEEHVAVASLVSHRAVRGPSSRLCSDAFRTGKKPSDHADCSVLLM